MDRNQAMSGYSNALKEHAKTDTKLKECECGKLVVFTSASLFEVKIMYFIIASLVVIILIIFHNILY